MLFVCFRPIPKCTALVYPEEPRKFVEKNSSLIQIAQKYCCFAEKCGKCSNIEKNQSCSFPFTWDNVEYNTCTTRIHSNEQDGTDKQLKCLTVEDEEISCSILPHCRKF